MGWMLRSTGAKVVVLGVLACGLGLVGVPIAAAADADVAAAAQDIAAPEAVASFLSAGTSLTNNQYIASPNGRFQLLVDSTGRILIRAAGSKTTLWSAGSVGVGGRLWMQGDGNLVGRNAAGTAIWNAGVTGYRNAIARLQDDGQLVLRAADGKAYWVSRTVVNTLWAGDSLRAGWQLTSSGGTHRLTMQADGNLVLRNVASGAAVWSTQARGASLARGGRAIMQGDGNFVVYPPTGRAVWASGTYQGAHASLVLSDNGTTSVRRGGDIVWSMPRALQARRAWQTIGAGGRPTPRIRNSHAGLPCVQAIT